MSPRALIVEDHPSMVESLTDILDVLQHACEAVGDMKAARERLAGGKFDYLILDMAIPVAPGRLADREVGRQLLGEIRTRPDTALLPVLVITGEDQGDGEFIQSVLRTGGYDTPLLAYLQKSALTCDSLSRKIQALLSGQPGATPPAPPQKPTSAFSSTPRKLTIYRHRIDVCGVQIWGETESPDMRTALLNLNQKDATGRYRAFRGPVLVSGRNASNPVASLFDRFRKSATARLREDRDLDCGRKDIIDNERRKGYFLREWMVVEVVGAEGPDDSTLTTSAPCDVGAAGAACGQLEMAAVVDAVEGEAPPRIPLTDRQRTLLTIMADAPIAQKELLAKAKVSKATLNRDLAPMREARLFTAGPDNQYFLTEKGRACV